MEDLGLLFMALIWGINFPVIKASLPAIPPLAFNAIRFPLASLTVLVVLGVNGRIPRPAREDWARLLILGIVGNVAYQGLFIFGLNGTLAGNASVLLATIPIWTLILSTLRGHEKPGVQVWVGIATTLVGMVLVVSGGGAGLGFRASTLMGDVLIVGAAIAWSIYTVGARTMIRKYGHLPVTAWTLWIGSVGLVAMGFSSLLDLGWGQVPAGAFLGVGFSGVFAIGLAYILWYRGVQRIGNSRTAAYQNLVPVVALAIAWAWLGEVPGSLQLLGAAVVLGGLTLARFGRDRGEASG